MLNALELVRRGVAMMNDGVEYSFGSPCCRRVSLDSDPCC